MGPVSLLAVGVATDRGKVRRNNEDSYSYWPHHSKNVTAHSGSLAIIADGVGGGAKGEDASRIAVQTFLQVYFDSSAGTIPSRLKLASAAANERVYEHAQSQGGATMATTLVAAAIFPDGRVHVLNVGDSRAYYYSHGRIVQLTRDHTVAQQMLDLTPTGETVTPGPAAHNTLTRSIGAETTASPDLFTAQLAAGDHIVLCSDGLYKELDSHHDLESALAMMQQPQQTAHQLVALANANGGTDNITVIVIQFGAGHERMPAGDELKTLLPPRALRPKRTVQVPLWALALIALISVVLVLAALPDSLRKQLPWARTIPTPTVTLAPTAVPSSVPGPAEPTAASTVPVPTAPAASTTPEQLRETPTPLATVAPEETKSAATVQAPAGTPAALVTTVPPPIKPGSCLWTVEQDETLLSIARQFLEAQGTQNITDAMANGVKETIIELNPQMTNPDLLEVGDILKIEHQGKDGEPCKRP